MLSPASLPGIMPPLPETTPPASLSLAPPPFSSPPSALSAMSPTVPLPINISPPVPSPARSIPPVFSPPPQNFPIPSAFPPVMSQVSPYPPVLSPQTSKASPPPAASYSTPPFPFPQPHPSRKFPRLAPLPSRITYPLPSTPTFPNSPISRVTSPPKSPVPQVTSPPSPMTKLAPSIPPPQPTLPVPSTEPRSSSSAATPTPLKTPMLPALAPESQLPFVPESKLPSSDYSTTPLAQPPSSSAGSLPVAVEVQKPLAFHMSTGLIIGLAIGGSVLLVFVLGILCLICRDRRKKKHDLRSYYYEETSNAGPKGLHVIKVLSSNTILQPYPTGVSGASVSANLESENPISNNSLSIAYGYGSVNGTFTYDELAVATNGFSEANLLGQGGFGHVYKGVLTSGKDIAVKQLKTGSQQGEREFQAEVETISRVHHKHLVELVGYCVNKAERLLVYEYVPNNTLQYHLHGEGRSVMAWETRMKVALGSGKGLTYLHEDCNPAIIHRDIKASNILLDSGFEAKVSDFGLAKIFPNTSTCITHITTRVVGTFGYLAPEYAASGILTEKSDVYSFGVMLLELITGRPPITEVDSSRNESLVDWARPLLSQALQDGCLNKLVDPRLMNSYKIDEMNRMITCAAACVRHSARLRPRMSQIVGALEGLVSLTDLVGDIIPGNTTLYSWSGNSNYDANQYPHNIRNFNLALSSPKHSFSGYSESTSDYGLHPSDSSAEVKQTNWGIK